MKKIKFFLIISLIFWGVGCSEDYLEPKALSILSAENVFSDESGYENMLVSCRKQLKIEYYDDNKMVLAEMWPTDMSVNGNSESDRPHNWDLQLLPTTTSGEAVRLLDFWTHGYAGIKFASIIISRIDYIKWKSEANRNAILAEAYFHRAYWYYRLVNQFGDIPWVGEEVTSPRIDFNTYSREAILKKIASDMETNVTYLNETVTPGKVNRAAGYHLLTKIFLELRQFDKAVTAATSVIQDGKHSLMTSRFGTGLNATNPAYNLIWDLHQRANKSAAVNKEGILIAQDRFGLPDCLTGTKNMRDHTPMYHNAAVKAPNGIKGFTDLVVTVDGVVNDFANTQGRGLGRCRPSDHYIYGIWKNCGSDYRKASINWFAVTDYVYNNYPSVGVYYGQHMTWAYYKTMGQDTIRYIYSWPYYKLFNPTELETSKYQGGNADWYIFRLAETYLLRAEAYYWLNQPANALADINAVRARANAPLASLADVTIDYIFDERSRELYAEEPRKSELTRVSYIMAQLGKDGYSLSDMSTKNWFYDRVIRCNGLYRNQVMNYTNFYKISPYHVYWPVPSAAIIANSQGIINQNAGYPSGSVNMTPIDVIN